MVAKTSTEDTPESGGPLTSPDVGLKVIRGAAVRGAGYGIGMLLTAAASVLLLRYLGVVEFGRYMTVISLIAIVGGMTDAGLMAVGGRELALLSPGPERRGLLANLIGLRLAVTPIGVIGATAFAIAVGYDRTLLVGVVLAGVGLILTTWQSTLILPLSVDLQIGRLTASELTKQATAVVGIALLVAAGSGLVGFFALSIGVALIALAASPIFTGRHVVWRPVFDGAQWRTLIREALPLAASVAMGVLYFRLLIVLMSLLARSVETGLFATSFRIVEILYGVSALVATTVLPVFAVAAADRIRIGYMLQRTTEVALIGACYLVLLVLIVAEPALGVLGGDEYRAAAPVLRIQVLALVPVFFAHTWQLILISIRRQSVLVQSSGVALAIALALGLLLIPLYQAEGAAIAAVAAEFGWAIALLVLLVRSDRALTPRFGFAWKILVALGIGAGAALIPGLPVAAAAAVATAGFAAGIIFTHALPREIVDALGLSSAEQPDRRA